MNDFLSLEFILPTLLLLFIIDLEIKARKLNPVRILAISFIYIAFLLHWINPKIETEVIAKEAIVISPAYSDSLFNSLRLKNKDAELIALRTENPSISKENSYQHIYDLLIARPDLKAFTILGEGIKEDERQLLKSFPVDYLGMDVQEGILSSNYKSHIHQNEEFDISGIVHNRNDGASLYLTRFDQRIDSLINLKAGKQFYQFRKKMKASAQLLFHLELKDADQKTIEKITLPLSIQENNNYSILMLAKQANTEINQLKNYIKSQGHRLQLRTGLSKNVYKYEAINAEGKAWTGLTTDLLSAQDLLIIDSESFNNLNRNESKNLIQAIENSDLGLFIFLSSDQMPKIKRLQNSFRLEDAEEKKFEFAAIGNSKTSELQPKHIIKTKNTKAIALIDDLMYQLQASTGKYTLSALSKTYVMKFKGEMENYKAYWEKVISLTARHPKKRIHFNTDKIFINRDMQFEASSELIQVTNSKNQKQELLSLKDPYESKLYRYQFIPKETGWYQIETADEKHFFYTHKDDDLKTMRQIKRSEENHLYFSKQSNLKQNHKDSIPLNPIWIYLIFLVGLGTLWFLDKK